MKILGIDISYRGTGVSIFDSDNLELTPLFIKSNKPSALNKFDKEGLLKYGINYDLVSEKNPKQFQIIWDIFRLKKVYDIINSIINEEQIDAIIVEKQFSKINELYPIIALNTIRSDTKMLDFRAFYPKSWHKILFGNGSLDNPKEKVSNLFDYLVNNSIINLVNTNIKINHDIKDSFMLVLTYLKAIHNIEILDLDKIKEIANV